MRVGNNGEQWQTTVKIDYHLHLENCKRGATKFRYSRLLNEALNEKFFTDGETKADLKAKIAKLALLVNEMAKRLPLKER